jgi:mono/diheme cytochrome c family protein
MAERALALLTAPLVSLMLISVAAAEDWGDPAAGREIADRWCSECHMVAPDQVLATPDYPTFMQIAEATGDDLVVLEGFLMDPHPRMPDLSLTRQEIRDLIGYFATLR